MPQEDITMRQDGFTIDDHDRRNAIATMSALRGGIPKLRLMGGTPHELVLHMAVRGGIISDDDCKDDFQANTNGIYMRATKEVNGETELVWLHMCSPSQLERALATRTHLVGEAERMAVAPDAAWQSIQWKDAMDRARRREKPFAARAAESLGLPSAPTTP